MRLLYGYLRQYGIKGLVIYTKLNFGYIEKMFVPNFPHPVYLRKGTSDVLTFGQVFKNNEYKIKFKFSPKTIIDAGGNIGLAAVYFANTYPEAKIITVEPEKANFESLSKNTKEYKNIFPLKRAISNLANQFLNVVDNGYGEWGFMTKKEGEDDKKKVVDVVETITIDQIIKEHNLKHIDILKIDIEGAEQELFESDFDTWLPMTRCLIIEFHDRMRNRSSQNFFKAIVKHDFSFSYQGENFIFTNNQFRND